MISPTLIGVSSKSLVSYASPLFSVIEPMGSLASSEPTVIVATLTVVSSVFLIDLNDSIF